MVMDERATYVSREWDKLDLYLRPGLSAPLTVDCVDDETGETVTFTRIADDSLRCITETSSKCTSDECHRRDPGICQCGLHPPFTLPDGRLNRGVKLERAT